VVYHAAGWLEGGLIACPEKFIMDCEILQMIQRYMELKSGMHHPNRLRSMPSKRSVPQDIILASSTHRIAT